MARCSGCGGNCSCVIEPGAGVAVDGSGSRNDPYVISAEGAGGGGSIPTATIWGWAGPAAPAGWLLCDGSTRSVAQYPDLAAALGSTYDPGGTAPAGSFRLPDLAGRVPLGADSTFLLGSQGGATQRAIAAENMPPHTHPMAHTHAIQRRDTGPGPQAFGMSSGFTGGFHDGNTEASSAASTGANVGGGVPLPTMPPYQTINFIIRT